MVNVFLTQVIASFIVGGIFVAALSIFAERAKKKAAGVIISLPSTVLVSYFFIGWTLSPQAVADIVPVTILVSGVIHLFLIAYLY